MNMKIIATKVSSWQKETSSTSGMREGVEASLLLKHKYCLWDQFRELESMSLLRSMHLAKFVADMLAGFSLSLAVLKVVDLVDVTHLTSKRIMHFRMLFEAISSTQIIVCGICSRGWPSPQS
ncbi:hypothetical protein RND81_06G105200 [Saponaria officinalis]|uniref:Mvd1 C-terminal domain-containing protein n=1 Tax=Saponaria officinalis TaxID=3572 RepID=A0AAW1K901_SAPOF